MPKKDQIEQVEVKSDGYKFAVTFLAAIGSILYTMYNYLHNTLVPQTLYYSICLLISLGSIIATGFILYLLIKGFSMEVKDGEHVKNLNNIARQIYLDTIVTFSVLVLYIISGFIISIFLGYGLVSIAIQTIILFIIIILTLFLFWPHLVKQQKYSVIFKTAYSKFHKTRYILIFIISGFIFLVITSLPSGHVTVDMDDIYYENDTIIPASIHVTGPYSDFKIILFKESDKLYEVTNISLISNPKANVDQDFLIATYQGNGKYKIFINTTNMTTGYYELWGVRQSFNQINGKKSFYLTDNRASY